MDNIVLNYIEVIMAYSSSNLRIQLIHYVLPNLIDVLDWLNHLLDEVQIGSRSLLVDEFCLDDIMHLRY